METKTANKAKQGDRGIHPKEKNKDKSPEEELNTIEISNLPEKTVFFCSVTELCPTLFGPHGLQHARLPSTTLCHRVCSNSYPLSQ